MDCERLFLFGTKVNVHVRLLRDVHLLTDREIEPGERWHDEIQGSVTAAKVAILLVSPNFLSSEYITGHELPNFIEAAENDGLKLFWIPIRPADYEGTEIAKIQAAHRRANPCPN